MTSLSTNDQTPTPPTAETPPRWVPIGPLRPSGRGDGRSRGPSRREMSHWSGRGADSAFIPWRFHGRWSVEGESSDSSCYRYFVLTGPGPVLRWEEEVKDVVGVRPALPLSPSWGREGYERTGTRGTLQGLPPQEGGPRLLPVSSDEGRSDVPVTNEHPGVRSTHPSLCLSSWKLSCPNPLPRLRVGAR